MQQLEQDQAGEDTEATMEVNVGHAADGSNVFIQYSQAINWYGMPPKQARKFAYLILRHVKLCRKVVKHGDE